MSRTKIRPKAAAPVSVPDRLLSPEEVCARLSVTERWLKRAIEEKRIVPVKMGRLNRFPESEINELVRTGLPYGDGR